MRLSQLANRRSSEEAKRRIRQALRRDHLRAFERLVEQDGDELRFVSRPPLITPVEELCGWTLARGHARSGDRIALAAYLGDDDSFDQAIASFAVAYADTTVADRCRLVEEVEAGRLPALREP